MSNHVHTINAEDAYRAIASTVKDRVKNGLAEQMAAVYNSAQQDSRNPSSVKYTSGSNFDRPYDNDPYNTDPYQPKIWIYPDPTMPNPPLVQPAPVQPFPWSIGTPPLNAPAVDMILVQLNEIQVMVRRARMTMIMLRKKLAEYNGSQAVKNVIQGIHDTTIATLKALAPTYDTTCAKIEDATPNDVEAVAEVEKQIDALILLTGNAVERDRRQQEAEENIL